MRPSSVTVPAGLTSLCQVDALHRAARTHGRGYPDIVRGFYGDYLAAPDVVAKPRTDHDVMRVLEWADSADLTVVPYGGGTSVVGGVARPAEAREGVVTLDVGAMDEVTEVQTSSLLAHIQAGATGPRLEAQLATHGLTLRHYPQSFEFSTLGGWIATRAGGHFATRYTHIDDLTHAVTMISPAGRVDTLDVPASGAGPDPCRVVLGSEGALGVITSAVMRVRPRPRYRSKVSVHFSTFASGLAAVRDIVQSGLEPSNCRLLDPVEAVIHGVAFGPAVLLLAFESAHHPTGPSLAPCVAICQQHGGTMPAPPVHTEDGAEGRTDDGGAWRKAFFEAPYLQSSLVTLSVLADTFETCCTWDRFDALHADVDQTMNQALRDVCGGGVVACRLSHVYSDGPAPYYTFIGRARRGSEIEQWRELKAAASEALLRHRATITHHHAVGRVHQPWYERQLSPAMHRAFAAMKSAMDPAWRLNPGVLWRR